MRRVALITGRNHHNCGVGFLAEWATGFPSYNNMIPKSTATLGAVLKGNGYNTGWFGKNHNTPDWESSIARPFDRRPSAKRPASFPREPCIQFGLTYGLDVVLGVTDRLQMNFDLSNRSSVWVWRLIGVADGRRGVHANVKSLIG